MRSILEGLNVDPSDDNYIETPERYARMLVEMFRPKNLEYATFPEEFTDFILLRNHTLYTLCPHHMLPVELVVSVAYIPGGDVLGLSKLARLLDDCNRGPLLQERFTKDVVEKLYEICVGCKGAAVLVDGQHGCTKVRGVRSGARFTTYKFKGEFEHSEILASRFITLSKG